MDYEKKYKEVLERAKELLEIGLKDTRDKRVVLSFFPELKESVSEKMIQYFKDLAPFDNAEELYEKYGFSHKDAIAWLEKQGEQKPAEWSKEDEWCLEQINFLIRNSYSVDDKVERLSNWLKSLKDRVQPQPKQEWNEEDINMIDWLIRCCEKEHKELCNDKYGHQDIVSDLKRDCRKKWDWLESLKNRVAPQKQWKPSKEQMEALLSEVKAWTKGCPKQVILESLYNDLKKLMEK